MMLRMVHKEYWIPFARRSFQDFKQDMAKRMLQPTVENPGVESSLYSESFKSFPYPHPNSEVSLLFHQYTSTPTSSTDLVMQQPWGLIILYFEFPQLCGYKREDILLVCNRKSLSRIKNLELQVYCSFSLNCLATHQKEQSQHPFIH